MFVAAQSFDIKALFSVLDDAGKRAMASFNKGRSTSAEIFAKRDGSIVTQADLDCNEIITERLQQMFPDIPIVSEEDKDFDATLQKTLLAPKYFLVDPIDGTSAYAKGAGDFSVNIGLVRQGRPILGAMHAPATGEFWFGDVRLSHFEYFNSVTKQSSVPARNARSPLNIILPSGLGREDQLLDWLGERYEVLPILNKTSSLKMCHIADGRADIYPRFRGSYLWDTAAGQAIVEASGGLVSQMIPSLSKPSKAKALTYALDCLTNPEFFALSARAKTQLTHISLAP